MIVLISISNKSIFSKDLLDSGQVILSLFAEFLRHILICLFLSIIQMWRKNFVASWKTSELLFVMFTLSFNKELSAALTL